MINKDVLLEFRHFLDSPQWGLFSEKIIEAELKSAMEQLLVCPLEEVEKHRGQIKALRNLLSLKLAARSAYQNREE